MIHLLVSLFRLDHSVNKAFGFEVQLFSTFILANKELAYKATAPGVETRTVLAKC